MNHHFCGCWRRSLQDGLCFDCCWCLWKFLKEMPSSPCPSTLHESVKFSVLTVGQKIIEEIQAKAIAPEGGPQCRARRQSSVPAAAARITDFKGCLLSGLYLFVMITFSQVCFQLVHIRSAFIATQTFSSLFLSYWRSGPFSSQQNIFPFCAVSKLSWVCCFWHYRFNLEPG